MCNHCLSQWSLILKKLFTGERCYTPLLECSCNVGQVCAFCVLSLILLHSFRSCLLRTRVRPLLSAADAVPGEVVDAQLRTVALSLRNCRRLGWRRQGHHQILMPT